MKNVMFVLGFILALSSCKKDIKTDEIAKTELSDPFPVNPYVWSPMATPDHSTYYAHNPEVQPFLALNNGIPYIGMGTYDEIEFKFNKNTQTWQPMPGNKNFFAHGFQLFNLFFNYGNSWYWGLSNFEPYIERDYFTRHVVDTDEHHQLATFPGTIVDYPLTFVVGNKGYLLGGATAGSTSNQFWEYNFSTDVWTNRGISPLGRRAASIAFVKDGKVYAGLGYDKYYLNSTLITQYKNDWLMFDPAGTSGMAAIKATFPGTKRRFAKGFSINSKFYIGWGEGNGNVYFNDMWEYNPSNNTWNEKTSCPAVSLSRNNIQVFSVGNTGYLVKGGLNEFWRYSNSRLVPTN